MSEVSGDELLGRIELIEAQPLAERARRFVQLHDEMLDELQRGDRGDEGGALDAD